MGVSLTPARGRLLDIAVSTTAASGKSTLHDIEGLASITFTVTNRPVLVTLSVPYIWASAGNIALAASITDDANAVKAAANGALGTTTLTAGNIGVALNWPCEEYIDTPGTYTRKGRIQRTGGTGTFSYGVDATTRTVLKAVEFDP